MVSSSSFDLAKKTKNILTQPRKNNSIKTPRLLKKMERIRHSSDPDVEAAAAEESPAPSITKSRTPPPSLCHGVVSVIGRTRAMADAVKVVPRLEIGGYENYFDFFAVYSGRAAVTVCPTRMHLTVAMEAGKIQGSIPAGESCRGWDYWNRVMGSSFQRMEEEIRQTEAGSDGGVKSGRWTAVVLMAGKEELVVADNNDAAGDCRAVLYRGGTALPLSRDEHPKPNDQPASEAERVQGKYIRWNLDREEVRVIGDRDYDHYVKPEVKVGERGEPSSEEFVVIGSKGLWDVVSNELACDIVAKCFNGRMRMRFADDTTENSAPAAAAFLAELAMARGSRDNVSVIVVKL